MGPSQKVKATEVVMHKPFTLVTAMLLALGAAVHLVRLILGIDIIVGTLVLPLWVSVVGVIVALVLCFGLLRERQKS
jgi:hypothetical protein